MMRLLFSLSLLGGLIACNTGSTGGNSPVSPTTSSNLTSTNSTPPGTPPNVYQPNKKPTPCNGGCTGGQKCVSTAFCTYSGGTLCDSCLDGGKTEACVEIASECKAFAADCSVVPNSLEHCCSGLICTKNIQNNTTKCQAATTGFCASYFNR